MRPDRKRPVLAAVGAVVSAVGAAVPAVAGGGGAKLRYVVHKIVNWGEVYLAPNIFGSRLRGQFYWTLAEFAEFKI